VLRAYDTTLADGLAEEHIAFRTLASSAERTALMHAFLATGPESK
jgi:hypothetical protein